MEEHAVVKAETQALAPLSIQAVIGRTALVRQVLEEVMIGPSKENPNGVHYGVIPGCGDKPTLLKPGAEKLCLTFRMAPEYIIQKTDLPREHREYEITCNLYSIPDHAFLASGVATASTMETKWRFRNKAAICPKCEEETIIKGKAEYGGGWLCWAKKGGCGAKFEDKDPAIINQDVGKTENDNPADLYNTVKKMSAKRSLTAATIAATSASDVFAQDLEDLKANGLVVDAVAVEVKDSKPEPETEPAQDGDTFAGETYERAAQPEPLDEGLSGSIALKIEQGWNLIADKTSKAEADRQLFEASKFEGSDGPIGLKTMKAVMKYADSAKEESKKARWLGSTLGKLRAAYGEMGD